MGDVAWAVAAWVRCCQPLSRPCSWSLLPATTDSFRGRPCISFAYPGWSRTHSEILRIPEAAAGDGASKRMKPVGGLLGPASGPVFRVLLVGRYQDDSACGCGVAA